jgi:hypothetical protein
MFRENKKYLIKTPTGFEPFVGVQKKNVNTLYTITFSDETFIKCSGGHALLTECGFIKAENITNQNEITGKKIQSISKKSGSFEVFDPVGVAEHHSYYSNDIISHNTEFLGSAHTLISAIKLRALAFTNPTPNNYGVDIYEMPIKNHTYAITVDTSDGVGLDYNVMNIIDITDIPYKQVAKLYNNKLSPQIFPEIIYRTGNFYNNAYVLVETNDGNGLQIAQTLHNDLEYENVLTTIAKGRNGMVMNGGFGTRPILGVKMTKQVKKIGCAALKDLVEYDKLIIQDFDTIRELANFVRVKETFRAEEGEHDDLAMSLVLFGWLTRQPYFRELTNNDARMKIAAERMAAIEDDMLPSIIQDDGRDDEQENLDKPLYTTWNSPFGYE